MTAAPFSLSLGDKVVAKLLAVNEYGVSAMSSEGEGAVVVLVPDAPISVADKPDVTLENQIGL